MNSVPSDLCEKNNQCHWQFLPPNAKALFLPTLGPMSKSFLSRNLFCMLHYFRSRDASAALSCFYSRGANLQSGISEDNQDPVLGSPAFKGDVWVSILNSPPKVTPLLPRPVVTPQRIAPSQCLHVFLQSRDDYVRSPIPRRESPPSYIAESRS